MMHKKHTACYYVCYMYTPGFASESDIRHLYETTQPWLVEHGEFSPYLEYGPNSPATTANVEFPSFDLTIQGEALRRVVPDATETLSISSELQISYYPTHYAGIEREHSPAQLDFWIGRVATCETISIHGPDYCLPWNADRHHYSPMDQRSELDLDELLESLSKAAALEAAIGIDRLTQEEFRALLSIATRLDDLST